MLKTDNQWPSAPRFMLRYEQHTRILVHTRGWLSLFVSKAHEKLTTFSRYDTMPWPNRVERFAWVCIWERDERVRLAGRKRKRRELEYVKSIRDSVWPWPFGSETSSDSGDGKTCLTGHGGVLSVVMQFFHVANQTIFCRARICKHILFMQKRNATSHVLEEPEDWIGRCELIVPP